MLSSFLRRLSSTFHVSVSAMHHLPAPKLPPFSADLHVTNRERLVKALSGTVPANSAVFLAGGASQNRYNTDADDLPFRQESYFYWTFGVREADAYGLIDLTTGKSYLFPPLLDPSYAIWDGKIQPESYFQERYKVESATFWKPGALADALNKLGIKNVLLLRADNTDSGVTLAEPKVDVPGVQTDTKTLYPILANLRVIKTEAEIDMMRYACLASCEAHEALMLSMRPTNAEFQYESLFRHVCHSGHGCRHLGYTCIAATGINSSILHYGHENAPNDRIIRDGDITLFDMGCEANCYVSDITCSFPVNGVFTAKQKAIYEAVLDANQSVFREAKPGVRWTDMHLLAERVILQHLVQLGILKGEVEALQAARIGAVFMPHGLGHFIGLDVHDVGGYLGDALPRSKEPGLKSLRVTRTLQPNMAITIEPGCYFIDTLLKEALADPKRAGFFNTDKLNEFRDFGGVRIEDVIIIRAGGNQNLSDKVPRTVADIEALMKKGANFNN